MLSIREIIEEDEKQRQQSQTIFDDERISSTLYHASFSRALRSIASDSKCGDKFARANDWLKDVFPECESISAISGDRLKERLAFLGHLSQDVQSCDALLILDEKYRGADGQCHLMVEFKNIDRATAIKFLKEGQDSVIEKCRGMANILKNEVYFFEHGDGKDVLANTHVAIVYSKKATGVKSGPRGLAPASKKADAISEFRGENPRRDRAGKSDRRQRRAAEMATKGYGPSKADAETFKKFGTKVTGLGYAPIGKDYMKLGEPDFKKEKGKTPKREFTLMSAYDMAELYKDGFFDKMMSEYGEI